MLDFIALGRYPHFHHTSRQYDQQCIDGVIDELALANLVNKPVGVLSGGEFQRVNLARVLVQEPELLLLDEPTNHLDPKAKIDLLQIVKKRKIATIAVLHDLHLAERFADQVMILNQGKMQVCGQKDKVLTAGWIKQTFDLDIIEVEHPQYNRTLKVFDI